MQTTAAPAIGAAGRVRTRVTIAGPPTLGAKAERKATPFLKAFAGSIGGLIEACTLQPIDTIKTRMQLNPSKYSGMIVTASTTAREEGVRSLWKGLTPFATHLYMKYALRFGTNAFFQVRMGGIAYVLVWFMW
jgi:solute carrier family 25 citrate transporter 1